MTKAYEVRFLPEAKVALRAAATYIADQEGSGRAADWHTVAPAKAWLSQAQTVAVVPPDYLAAN